MLGKLPVARGRCARRKSIHRLNADAALRSPDSRANGLTSSEAWRDGSISELPAAALVPGDVVALAEGDHVPADCRLIEAFDMRVDNAVIAAVAAFLSDNRH